MGISNVGVIVIFPIVLSYSDGFIVSSVGVMQCTVPLGGQLNELKGLSMYAAATQQRHIGTTGNEAICTKREQDTLSGKTPKCPKSFNR